MRVLFVDDEPSVLRSLARGLKVRRPPWEPVFAGGGDEALDMLEKTPVDVVVSDVSMPGMDGISLLGHVRDRFPQVSRVVLSGNVAASSDPRSIVALHQWLSKPCSVVDICATIERLAWARGLVEDPALVRTVTELASLPSPPLLFVRLTEAARRLAPIGDLAALVATDAAIAAKLLQLVNTAFYGEARRVSDLHRAIALLGSDRLRTVVLAAELFRSADVPVAVVERSQRVARIAAALAPAVQRGDAYIAGLLHDVGRLATAGKHDDAAPLAYARLGGLLLGTWGLPMEIAASVAYQHDPDGAPASAEPPLRVVSLSIALADEHATGTPGTLVADRAAVLGLDPATCRERAAVAAATPAAS